MCSPMLDYVPSYFINYVRTTEEIEGMKWEHLYIGTVCIRSNPQEYLSVFNLFNSERFTIPYLSKLKSG